LIWTDWNEIFIEDVNEFNTEWWYIDLYNEIKKLIENNNLTTDEVFVVLDPAMWRRRRWIEWVHIPSDILSELWLNIYTWDNDNKNFIRVFKTLVKLKKIHFNLYKNNWLVEEIKK